MSDQGKRLIEQLKAAAANSRIDPALAQTLLEAITEVMGDQLVDVRKVSVEELSKRYQDIDRLLSEQKDKIEGVIDLEKKKLELLGQEAYDLKRKIEFMVTQDEVDEKELETARKRYKEIKKIVKLQEDYDKGLAKGEAAAERLLQATFGLSKGWENLSGKGLLEGFTKGIAETMQWQNVLVAITAKMFETMLRMDKARAALFQRSQITREQLNVGEAAAAMGQIGTNLEGVAAEAASSLKENFLSFSELTTGEDSQLVALTAGIGTLSKLGVSMDTQAQIIGTQVKALGQTPEQAKDLLFNLAGVARALGRPPQEMAQDFKNAQPILARFEAELGRRIFKDTAFMAAKLGIEVNQLLQMNENMDTFEGAAKFAQSINIAFGAPLVSAQALLAAESPAEKRKVIMDSLAKEGRSIKELSARELRALAKEPTLGFGGDVAKLKQFMDAEADLLESDREGLDAVATDMQGTQSEIADQLSVATKIDAAMEQAIRMLVNAIGGEKGLMELTNVVVGMISFFTDNIALFSSIMMGMAMNTFGLGSAAQIGTVIGMGAGASFAGTSGEEREKRIQDEREKKWPTKGGSTKKGPDNLNEIQKRMEGTVANANLKLPGGTKVRGSSKSNVKAGKNEARTDLQFSASSVARRGTNQAAPTEDSNSAQSLGPVMATPNIARNYMTPVFDKNDVFYAAKADGALATMIKGITEIVAEIAAKKSDLKLSMKERDAGQMVVDGLNAIKRL